MANQASSIKSASQASARVERPVAVEQVSQTSARVEELEAELAELKAAQNSVRIIVPMKRTGRLLSNRIDLSLSTSQAQTFRDLFDGLNDADAQLKNGKFIERPQQAILWLLENITPIK